MDTEARLKIAEEKIERLDKITEGLLKITIVYKQSFLDLLEAVEVMNKYLESHNEIVGFDN